MIKRNKKIMKLFKKNYKSIILKSYKPKKQLINTKLNFKKNLPDISNWSFPIRDFLLTNKT